MHHRHSMPGSVLHRTDWQQMVVILHSYGCPQGESALMGMLDVQDLDTVVARKKRRSVNKTNVRPIGNASIEVLQKRRAEKPEQRKASREAALRYVNQHQTMSETPVCRILHAMLPLHAHELGGLPSSSQSLLMDRAFSVACFHTYMWPCLHVALSL